MAKQTLNVTVKDVTSRSDTSKAGNPYTLYRVTLSDGNTYKTFKNEVGAKAQQAKNTGTPIKATVHSESRDGFPDDLLLDAVEPSGNPNAMPVVSTNDGTQTRSTQSAFVPSNGHSRDEEIRANMAFKLAVQYYANNGSGDVETDLPLIESMAKVIYQKATAEALTASQESQKAVTETW